MTLGGAIKLIRTARGRKQVDIATVLDVSANYLSLVEKDKREPSIGFLRRLAAELQVPVSLLFLYQELQSSPASNSELAQVAEILVRLQTTIRSEKKRRGRTKVA